MRLGVVNNYRQDNLDIDFKSARHLAVCAREDFKIKAMLDSILLSLKSIESIYILEGGALNAREDSKIESKNVIMLDSNLRDLDSVKEDSYIIIKDYDKAKNMFIDDYGMNDLQKQFREFIESSFAKNINIIFFIAKPKQVFAKSKIYEYIDNFISLNMGGAVDTILKDINDMLSSNALYHKNFYYNKLTGDITQFRNYSFIS